MKLIAALVVIIAFTLLPSEASARAACLPGQVEQADIAGVYSNVAAPMVVTVSPCGAVFVVWENALGRHEAIYQTVERKPDGGLIAGVTMPDPWVGPLDGRLGLGIKPAEPGYVQMVTASMEQDWIKIYRLRKIA